MSRALEVLAPAGDAERLEAALRFGADAVYLAGQEFGMRSASANFSGEELIAAVNSAHKAGAKVYLTCNTIPRNDELPRLPEFLAFAQQAGVDALIVADMGVFALAKRCAPQVELHVSTQAGVANWETARAFYEMGASRVVLARELPLCDIAEIRAKTPPELELEAFVHGSMCVSFSGRCLLSNYLTGRDANRGGCAQPCRWKYALMEEKRPGQYFPIEEEHGGSFVLNSRDLCMIEHIPELVQAGVTSLKIEGRAKSSYYVAVVTNAYRCAADAYRRAPQEPIPGWIAREVEKISHREYSTGFYFGGEPGQATESGGYIREWEIAAFSRGMRGNLAVLAQRNRFFCGETLEVLEPGCAPYPLVLNRMMNEQGELIDAAPHAEMIVLAETPRPIAPNAILRRRVT